MAKESLNELRDLIHKKKFTPSLGSNTNLVLFRGVVMKDLTFIDEGNPDWVKVNNVKLINFAKRRMIYNLIFNSVLRFQQFKYDIETEDDLQEVINHLPKLEENILEEQSLKIEPRNAARVDLR
jgi:2-phospho-L-lactate guanylyltransferase (CobY/MobA/RfbA family)